MPYAILDTNVYIDHWQGKIADEVMTLHCETDDPALQMQAPEIVATIRDITKLRGEVRFAPRGSLPNDGKIIDDVRDYS